MSDEQISRWTVDFHQAKIALRNLEFLISANTTDQIQSVAHLKQLFASYGRFVEGSAESSRNAQIIEQVNSLARVEKNMEISTAKFASKAKSQLEAARAQVSSLHTSLTKLKTLKAPQHAIAVNQLSQQVPGFMDLFDSFLARFTLQMRVQQADFYKQWGDAINRTEGESTIPEVKAKWRDEFSKIMPALEIMKSVNPHVTNSSHLGTTATTQEGGEIPDMEVDRRPGMATAEKMDAVLMAPVKWIHSKISPDIRPFRFTDPRMGFFSKAAYPPTHDSETVVAIYDFEGETESDLSFKKDDVITVVDRGTQEDPNWWCGEFNNKRGLFPKNYVELPGEKLAVKTDPAEYVPRITAPPATTAPAKDSEKVKSTGSTLPTNSDEPNAKPVSTTDEPQPSAQTMPDSDPQNLGIKTEPARAKPPADNTLTQVDPVPVSEIEKTKTDANTYQSRPAAQPSSHSDPSDTLDSEKPASVGNTHEELKPKASATAAEEKAKAAPEDTTPARQADASKQKEDVTASSDDKLLEGINSLKVDNKEEISNHKDISEPRENDGTSDEATNKNASTAPKQPESPVDHSTTATSELATKALGQPASPKESHNTEIDELS